MRLCRRVVFAIFFFFIACLVTSAFAGNKKMVENRTEEMDDLNKQMVRQIPNLPKDGKVDAKAKVVDEGGNLIFDIYHVKTSVKEESLDFNGEQQKKEAKKESSDRIEEQSREETNKELTSDTQGNNKDTKKLSDEERKKAPNEEVASDTKEKDRAASSLSNEKVSE